MNKGSDYVINICRMGQGAATCRYLGFGPNGFECEKLTDLKAMLDDRVTQETMQSRGDNCEGQPGEIR